MPMLCEQYYFAPVAKVNALTTVPVHRTAQILTQSQNSDNEFNQPMFHTKNAVRGSAVWTCVSPVVGGVQGGHGKANLLMGAVPPLCPRRSALEGWHCGIGAEQWRQGPSLRAQPLQPHVKVNSAAHTPCCSACGRDAVLCRRSTHSTPGPGPTAPA